MLHYPKLGSRSWEVLRAAVMGRTASRKQAAAVARLWRASAPVLAEQLESRTLLSLTPINPDSAIPFEKITIDAKPGATPVVKVLGDLTNSGDEDAIIGHEATLGYPGLFWYDFPSSGNPNGTWNKYTIDASADCYEQGAVVDVAGNVDSKGNPVMDVIMEERGSVYWYENPLGEGINPTTVTSWSKHLIGTITQGATHELYLADLNGDGKFDVVTNTAIFFQNSPTSWTEVANPTYNRTQKGLYLFDSGSGHGAIDLLGTGEASNGYDVGWYQNPRDTGGNAETGSWIFHPIGPAYGNYVNGDGVSYAAMDVNGDGKEDIITCDGENGENPPYLTGGLIWWQAPSNDATGTWTEHQIDANVIDVHNLVIGDINGDGTPDILAFEQDQSPQHRLMVVYNVGGSGTDWQEQTLGTEGAHNEKAGDINGDGDLDILTSPHGFYTGYNPIEIYWNELSTDGTVLPTITTLPQSQTIAAGQPVTFSVAASGTAPFAYDWQYNDVPIAGADSSTYTISSVDADDAGQYRCVVSNGHGFIPSASATLTVGASGPSEPASPTPGAPVLAAATDSGGANATNYNNSSSARVLQFTVSGTVSGATVNLYANGTLLGSATASGTSTKITTNGTQTLPDGSESFTASQTVPGDSTSASSSATQLTIDTTAPKAASTPPVVATAGATSYTFTVVYTDSGSGVETSTLGNNNLTVSNSTLGFSQNATLVSSTPTTNANTVTATYSITPPGGSWSMSDNGSYMVALNAGQVSDTAENTTAAATIGTLNVEIGVAIAGSIAGSEATAASSYNLTTLGASDWAHWGRAGVYSNFDHDVSGSSQISNVSIAGTGASTGGNQNTSHSVSWTNGTPTVSDTGDSGYIWDNGAVNTGFSFTVPADTTTRTLVVYGGGYGSGITLTAQLSDGSTTNYVGTASGAGNYTSAFTITYNAGSAGQTLTITLLKTSNIATSGASVDLVAAYLVAGGSSTPPAEPTSPAPGAPVLAAATDSSGGSATNFNNSSAADALQFTVPGTVAGATVNLYANGTLLGSATASGTSTKITTNGTQTLPDGSESFTASQTVPGDSTSASSSATQLTIDTTAPKAASTPPVVATAGATSYTFTVVYTDSGSGVETSTLGNNNLTVSNSTLGFSQNATLVSSTPTTNANTVTATYSITPPGGSWSMSDNGSYMVALNAGQVSDTAENTTAAATIGTLNVEIGVAIAGSIAGSEATAASSYNLTTLGASDWAHWGRAGVYSNFDHDVSGSSQISNVSIAGTGASTGGNQNTSHSVSWTNGTPTVSDTGDSGYIWDNGAVNTGFSFTVPADTTTRTLVVYGGGYGSGITLTAQLSDGSTTNYVGTASGAGNYTSAFTITYNAGSAGQTLTITLLKTSNIATSGASVDLVAAYLVAGGSSTPPAEPTSPAPGAPVLAAATDSSGGSATNFNNSSAADALQFTVPGTVAGATVNLYANGTLVGSATASGTSTKITTNGSQTLPDGSESFTATQNVTGDLVSVNSLATAVTIDTTPPKAVAAAPAVLASGATSYTFTVVYTDSGSGVEASTLGSSNVLVSNSTLGFSQDAAFVSAAPSTNATTVTATYSITPPGGSWSMSDNGAYAIALNASQVSDVAGNIAPAATIGTLNVEIGVAIAGSIAGSEATAASSYNLTTLGASDWAHWGRAGVYSNFDHDVSGSSQISNVSIAGTGASTGGNQNTSHSVSWTNGTPTVSDTGDSGYIWDNGAVNTGFSFTVPADTTTRTLVVYGGGYGSGITLTAQLSDGSTTNYVGTASGAGNYTSAFTITYNAGSAGQTLTITLLKTSNIATSGASVDLVAAYLVAGSSSSPPSQAVSPTPGAPVLAAATDSSGGSATNFNNSSAADALQFTVPGTVAGATVNLYANGTLVGSATASGTSTTITTNGSQTLPDGSESFTATQIVTGDLVSVASAATVITIDTTAPTAVATAPELTAAGATTYQFTVVYTDSGSGVQASTLGSENVLVSNATLGFSQDAEFVSSTPAATATAVTATYSITPPDGSWSMSDDGVYMIALNASQIADAAGNIAAAGTIGTLDVQI